MLDGYDLICGRRQASIPTGSAADLASRLKETRSSLGFVGPCIFTHSNEPTNEMQQLITGLLFVV